MSNQITQEQYELVRNYLYQQISLMKDRIEDQSANIRGSHSEIERRIGEIVDRELHGFIETGIEKSFFLRRDFENLHIRTNVSIRVVDRRTEVNIDPRMQSYSIHEQGVVEFFMNALDNYIGRSAITNIRIEIESRINA